MRTTLLLPILLSWFTICAFGQVQPRIYMDGFFEDWQPDTAGYSDPPNDGIGHDFLNLAIRNDSSNLYLKLELAQEINLQDFNYITIYIDIDDNPATGTSVNNIGADFSYTFGTRSGKFHNTSIQHAAVGLITLPTITSDIFEIAFNRHATPVAGQLLFPQNNIKIVLRDDEPGGDTFPNSGSISYTFHNLPVEPYPLIDLEREDSSFIRLMNYNVLSDGPMNTAKFPYFNLIFRAIHPDIFAFQEFWNSTANDVKTIMDNTLPTGTVDGWHAVKADAGNITLSRWPILDHWVVYPGSRITAVLIDLPESYAKNLLVINAHFSCCTANSSRQNQADAVVDFFRDMKSPGGNIDLADSTPVVILGDLNLVGFAQQLETLLTGDIVNENIFGSNILPDWDDTPLADLVSYHTDAPLATTWHDEYSGFAPGRLDYMIYTNSSMTVEKAFTLRTEEMPYSRLNKYTLDAQATGIASDHLPKVADFSLEMAADTTTIGTQELPGQHIHIWPNPATSILNIILEPEEIYELELMDISGRTVLLRNNPRGSTAISIAHLPAGIYFLRLSDGKNQLNWKVVKQ